MGKHPYEIKTLQEILFLRLLDQRCIHNTEQGLCVYVCARASDMQGAGFLA